VLKQLLTLPMHWEHISLCQLRNASKQHFRLPRYGHDNLVRKPQPLGQNSSIASEPFLTVRFLEFFGMARHVALCRTNPFLTKIQAI
jgi:hypothetical protein